MPKIEELERKIRDYINSSRRRRNIQKRINNWYKLCSSLDTLGDTQLSIRSFNPQEQIVKNSDGNSYLIIYGLLQSLFLQQDSVTSMAESVGLKVELPSELKRIRRIRNDSSGHPTNRNFGEYFCVINRNSISSIGFRYSIYGNKQKDFLNFKVVFSELLQTQNKFIIELLLKIVGHLKTEEESHKQNYRDLLMEEIFPQTLGYHFQKMDEVIENPTHFELGIVNLTVIEKVIHDFETELNNRDEIDDWWEYHKKKVDYPLEQLRLFFTNDENCEINSITASIFVWYTKNELKEWRDLANEIDNEYNSGI